MCLMLYLATSHEQPLRRSSELSVEEIEPSREAVRQWFSLPIVRFIGAHTGCSCGFSHVVSEKPIEYWDGMFDGQDREADLRSVDSLLDLVREHVRAAGEVQLYPVWDGGEAVRRRARSTWNSEGSIARNSSSTSSSSIA